MIEPQREVNHERDFGDDLGAAKAGDEVANVAVVLLDAEGQVFPVKSWPSGMRR